MDLEARIDQVLSTMNYGTYVVTAKADGQADGVLASLVMQTSFRPRRLAVGIAKSRNIHHLMERGKTFVVNLLSERDTDLMARFGGRHDGGDSRFSGVRTERGVDDVPILSDALGYVECRVVDTYDAGDHTLFIADVVNGEQFRAGRVGSTAQLNLTYEGD